MGDVLVLRVAARFAREFATPEALKEYLHEHPDADKSKHHVVENKDEKKPKSEGPSEKATAWLSKAKGSVKSFFSDATARREMLTKASEAIEKAPEKAGRKAIEIVKKEVKDAKTAFDGVKTALAGGKLTPEHKTAMKTVGLKIATSVAIGAVGVALPAALGGAVAKAVAKTVAKKALRAALGHFTGIKLAAMTSASDPEAWLAKNIAEEVAKAVKGLSEEDLQEILEAVAEEDV